MDYKEPVPDDIAERSVLAGTLEHGEEAYLDVADIVSATSFTDIRNQVIFKCIKHIYEKDNATSVKIDPATLLSASKECGYSDFFERKENAQYLRALFNFGNTVELESIRRLGAKIRKLEIARDMQKASLAALKNLEAVTGQESVESICNMAEEPLIKTRDKLLGQDNINTKQMGDGLDEFVDDLIANPDRSYGIPTPWPLYNKAIGGGLARQEIDVIAARMKVGKAQKMDSIIYTPNGYKLMKDIVVGDTICHPQGLTKVIALHPQGKLPVYKVYFNDKTFCECSGEHLFTISHRRYKKQKDITLSVKDIKKLKLYDKYGKRGDKQTNYYIKLTEPTDFKEQETSIHPYLMGCLLGDGGFSKGSIILTNFDNDLVEKCQALVQDGYELAPKKKVGNYILRNKKKDGKNNIYISRLKDMGLMGLKSGKKFIPKNYLYNSVENRLELLRGLLDTDGGNANHCLEYSTKSEQLAFDVKELVESLGGICIKKKRTTQCNGKKFRSYRLRISFNNCQEMFYMNRKVKAAKIRKKPELKRWITKVVKTKEVAEMQCITVEANDGLYLTNNFIVTHNSFSAENVAYYVAKNYGIPVFNVDTELSQKHHWIRLLAVISGVEMNDIKTGAFVHDEEKLKKVLDAKEEIKTLPYYFDCVGGRGFEEVLAIMRRWVTKTVGFDENGNTKDCLVIYDYIKLLSEEELNKNMSEHQALGFLVTSLKNFLIRYDVPCLAFAQLNRDGIEKHSTDAIGGSDRIAQYVSSVAFFKEKTPEEIAEFGYKLGNRKMHVVVSRNGEGTDMDKFIHMNFEKPIGRITEIPEKMQKHVDKKGFEDTNSDNDDDNDPIEFG